MSKKLNISPKAWELLNNLTATIHGHAEMHDPADYAEKARAEDALSDYIATLEAEVEALKPYRDGYDPKVTPPTEEGKYIFGYRNGHVNMSWSFGKPDEFTQDDIVRWWPLPEVGR